jgi:hypothetical protein
MNGTFDQERHSNGARKGDGTFLLITARLILIAYIKSMERKTQKI